MKQIHIKTERMIEVEQRFQEPIEELLRRLFVDEGKTLYEIADELGIAYRIVLKWLDKAGIYSRNLRVGE